MPCRMCRGEFTFTAMKPGLKRVATLCVLKHGRRLLLLHRLKEPNKGKYAPVGGKIEPYETPLQSVKRETWEETGVYVDNPKFCGILTETSPTDYNWTSYVYVADIDLIDPPPCPEGTLEWIDFDGDRDAIPTPKTDWFVYQYILDGKPFAFSATFDDELNMLEMVEDIEGIRVV